MSILSFSDKTKDTLVNVAAIVSCYFLFILLIKLFDTINLCFIQSTVSVRAIGYAFCHNFIATACISVVFLILYLLLSLVSKKIAFYVLSIISSFFIIAEVGIDIFSAKSGVLLGNELLARPIGETIETIYASVGYWTIIFCIGSIVFIFFHALLCKKIATKIGNTCAFIILVCILLLASFIWCLSRIENKFDKPQEENYVTHKVTYFMRSCWTNITTNIERGNPFDTRGQSIEIDENKLQQFVNLTTKNNCLDIHYPLERESSSTTDVLSPFFKQSNIKPNIVFIVVESLGREWSGKTDLGVSYTPFIDSLAQHSLYWSNCLSTTKRSFGAVPTITGSLPHGPRGFQLGNMPTHNTMLSILKNDGYQTNAFYASDFSFDAIRELLSEQQIDYMSVDLQQECFSRKGSTWGTYWGYHDEFMLSRSLEILSEQPKEPYCNLYITISSHDEINERNAQMDAMLQKTHNIISQLPKEEQASQLSHDKKIATMVYTDYALQQFFAQYAQRPEFEHTIFVISGDHSAEIDVKNRLGMYHVPLIIYSPLLQRTGYFTSLITHADIAPSLLSLLQNKYNVQSPEMVSWVSDGLDTSRNFKANKKKLLMDYAHDIGEIVFDNYFFYKEKNAVYEIDSNLNLKLIEDKAIYDSLENTLSLFKYVNNYMYLNDKLTRQSVLNDNNTFSNIEFLTIDSLECFATEKNPKEQKPNTYHLIDNHLVKKNLQSKNLRISITADICITGNVWQDYQMSLFFECQANGKSKQVFSDKIVKFVLDEHIESGKWYRMNISKKFDITEAYDPTVSLYIQTTDHVEYWKKDNHLSLKNIEIYIDEQ